MTHFQNRVLPQAALVAVILLLVALMGCLALPVSYSEAEKQFDRNVKRLVGSDTVAVRDTLGQPTSRVRLYDSTVYIYARLAKRDTVLCYNLKFDSDDILVEFRRDRHSYAYYSPSPRNLCQLWVSPKDYLYDTSGEPQAYDPEKLPVAMDYYECDYEAEKRKRDEPVYWKPVKHLWYADEAQLTAAAESGNPEARLQLYWHDTKNGLYWLCRAANQGDAKARYRVAQLYEFGDDGIQRDLLKAYVWYDLAAQACHPWARKDALRISRSSLSKDALLDAKHMVEQWSAVDCKNWLSNP